MLFLAIAIYRNIHTILRNFKCGCSIDKDDSIFERVVINTVICILSGMLEVELVLVYMMVLSVSNIILLKYLRKKNFKFYFNRPDLISFYDSEIRAKSQLMVIILLTIVVIYAVVILK